MKTDKTILIGPTGFLGPAFLEKNPSITAVGRSELPSHLENEFFHIDGDDDFDKLDQLEFDNVIFLIGCSDHHLLNSHPTLALEKNVMALSKFLWYLRKSNRSVKKIINFTTMLQYDTKRMSLPCDESQPRNASVNNYILSKYVSELVTQQHRDMFDIIDVRISNVYGPTRLMRPDIVPSTIWSLIINGEASVWTKKPKRDFIYVEDAVDAVMMLLNTEFSGSVNLGTGVGHTVGELCKCLEDVSGIEITDQDIQVQGHMEFYQDISLLQSLIEWKPKYTLKSGLEKTYKLMHEYYQDEEVKKKLGSYKKN